MILSRKLSAPAEWNRRTTTSILRSPDLTARRPAAGRSPAGRAATAERARDSPSALAWDGSFARNWLPSMRKNSDSAGPRISNCTSDVRFDIASDRIVCRIVEASSGEADAVTGAGDWSGGSRARGSSVGICREEGTGMGAGAANASSASSICSEGLRAAAARPVMPRRAVRAGGDSGLRAAGRTGAGAAGGGFGLCGAGGLTVPAADGGGAAGSPARRAAISLGNKS